LLVIANIGERIGSMLISWSSFSGPSSIRLYVGRLVAGDRISEAGSGKQAIITRNHFHKANANGTCRTGNRLPVNCLNSLVARFSIIDR
jgi:hypothetical protein